MTTGDKIAKCLHDRRPFSAGALSARAGGPFTQGQMPAEEYKKLLAMEPYYVVYSYQTPIAWLYGNKAVIPEITYSPTTAKHQHIARKYL